jgi:hypothetical protein
MSSESVNEQQPAEAEALFNITPGSLPEGIEKIHPQHDDIFCWQVIYSDGSTLLEVEGDVLHHFSDIDLKRVAGFILLPLIEGISQHAVQLDGEKRLIFVRRRPISYNPNNGEVSWTVWHIMGYQQTINGKNVKSLTYVAMNGDSFMSDDDNVALADEQPAQE